jgi:hypothetical protein
MSLITSTRRTVTAGLVAGAVILGGAGWAAAQTPDDSTTTTGSPEATSPDAEAPGTPSEASEDCRHGERGAAPDTSTESGDAEAETSSFVAA